MMRKLFGRFVIAAIYITAMLWAGGAQAQHVEHHEFLLHNAEAGAAVNGAVMPVDQYATVAVDVTITVTGTVNFEASAAGGVWSSMTCLGSNTAVRTTNVPTATATGLFQCNVAGFQAFRARISANAGTITVFARATTGGFQ